MKVGIGIKSWPQPNSASLLSYLGSLATFTGGGIRKRGGCVADDHNTEGSNGLHSVETDISRFDEWLNSTWHDGLHAGPLSDTQKGIVARNVLLVCDREAWARHVGNFEASVPEDRRKYYTVYFDTAEFTHSDFWRRRFPCPVSFAGVKFTGGVTCFAEVEFRDGNVNFSGAMFNDAGVDFSYAEFGDGHSNFSYAEFGDGGAEFRGVLFGNGIVEFWKCDFGQGDVDFSQASFERSEFYLDDCTLGGRFNLSFVAESRGLVAGFSMRGVRFRDVVDFSGREFADVPDFVGSSFQVPPDLSDVKIAPPEMIGGKFGWFQKARQRRNAACYRKLKAMAIAVNDHEKELEFFAHETRAKRWHEQGTLASVVSGIYELLSDYGQSLKRPLVAWVVSILLTTAAYGLSGMGFERALLHSLTVGLPFMIALMGSPAVDNLAQELLTMGQLMISLILIFLFFLGLRNRFKIR